MDEYPNEGENAHNQDHEAWVPEKPAERTEAEAKEKAMVTTSVGVIRDVLTWFEEQSAGYSSIDALEVNEGTDPNAALIALSTAKRMKQSFDQKATLFKAQFEEYLVEVEEESDPVTE